jgi:hypothetical protein
VILSGGGGFTGWSTVTTCGSCARVWSTLTRHAMRGAGYLGLPRSMNMRDRLLRIHCLIRGELWKDSMAGEVQEQLVFMRHLSMASSNMKTHDSNSFYLHLHSTT